jgi:endonuclease YncB( thermonuclease family)
MRSRVLSFFIVLFLFVGLVYAKEPVVFSGVKVSVIVDGDTFHANLPEVGNRTIRIWSIDSPEKKQRCGPQATEFLASLIWDKPLKLKIKAKDQYGRLVAQVFHEGVDIGLVMVRYGFAWHYVAISKDKSLIQAQADAKKQKLGLWSDANPIAPWVYRKTPKAQ